MAFPFLQLPGEVRNLIYELVTAPVREKTVKIKHAEGCTERFCPNLAQVCRQIRQEYLPLHCRSAPRIQIDYDDLVPWMQTFSDAEVPKSQNQRLDNFGSWREYVPAYAEKSTRSSIQVGTSAHKSRIPEELHINVKADEGQRPKYIDILPLLLLNVQQPQRFACKVICSGEEHPFELWPFGGQNIIHTEFEDGELRDSLNYLLSHSHGLWKKRLSCSRYALLDLYHERHLVIALKPSLFHKDLRSKQVAEAEMGFKNTTGVRGVLSIDLHPTSEFTGLTEGVLLEPHKSSQETESNMPVPWQSQKWNFFGRSRISDD